MKQKQNSLFIVCKRHIETLYAHYLKPIQTNEDTHRKELVCTLLLIFILFFTIFLNILVFRNILTVRDYTGISPYITLSITGSVVCLLYFLRLGFVHHVSKIFIWILVLLCTYAQIMWGIDLPSVILFWCFIITASSILISTYYSFILSIYIGVSATLLQLLEENKIFVPYKSWKYTQFELGDAIEFSIVFILIAGVSWISNREIYKSLQRARLSESNLQKERDALEITVAERTAEVKRAQTEKINSMYRLVEFGRISSGLFHDLMTPLNTLSFLMKNIQDKSTEQLQQANLYIEQCAKTSTKISNFLAMAKTQLRQDITSVRFGIIQEIENIIQLLQAKARQKDVKLVFIHGKNLHITASPILFGHIITNLISNAIDAYAYHVSKMSQKSQIEAESAESKSSIVLIYCQRKNKCIEIKVKDFGAGIPLEIQEHIFEPFFTTKNTDGCGIGLSATKHTLEKYFNGKISFISNTAGTIFTITLPITKNDTHSQKNIQTMDKDSILDTTQKEDIQSSHKTEF